LACISDFLRGKDAAFAALLCLLLGACSSVSVIEEHENTALVPKSPPSELLVRPFGISKDAPFDVAQATPEEDVRKKVGYIIAEGVLSRGSRWIAPSRILEAGQKPPRRGVLIEGRLLMAQQGSRILRLGIGLGAGRTRMETTVNVYNLEASAEKPWLSFKTTGGSNIEPGLLAGLIVPSPVTVPILLGIASGAASTVGKLNKGVTQDSKRTGRTVVALVHDALVTHGLAPRKAWPKRSGSLGTPAGQLNFPGLE